MLTQFVSPVDDPVCVPAYVDWFDGVTASSPGAGVGARVGGGPGVINPGVVKIEGCVNPEYVATVVPY